MSLTLQGGRRGIGTRVVTAGRGDIVESRLLVARDLVAAEGFIGAVSRSHDALSGLDHPQLALVRALEHLRAGGHEALEVVSTHPQGETLDHLLDRLASNDTPLTTAAALYVLREVLAVARALHAHRAGSFHGALTLDAIVVTSDQQIIVRDQVFGRALSTLAHPPATWWARFGLAIPTTTGIPPFTPLTDQFQVGVIALSALLGRPLDEEDDLAALDELLEDVTETSIDGEEQPLGPALKAWLSRILLVAPEGPFRSLNAAGDSLDELLDAEAGYVAAPIGLDVEIAPDDVPPPIVAVSSERSYDPFARPTDVAPPAVEAPPATAAYIIESNDGRAAALTPSAGRYEPFAVTPRGPEPAATPAASVYASPHEHAIETNAPAVAMSPPLVASPVAPVAAITVTPTVAAADAAPKPFWELPGPAAATPSPGRPAPDERRGTPVGIEVASPSLRPVADRGGVAPGTFDLVVNAPPPTLGPVRPVETAQVSTHTSPLLRAAVAEFEHLPTAPTPTPAPATAAVQPPMAAAHEPVAMPVMQAPAIAPKPEPARETPMSPAPAAQARVAPPAQPHEAAPRPSPAKSTAVRLDTPFELDVAPRRSRGMLMVVAVVLLATLAVGAAGYYFFLMPRATVVAGEPGRLRLESKPVGATVRVNGEDKGVTPLTLPVAPGSYRIEFARGDQVRRISAAVTSNNETYQAVTLYPPGPPGEVAVTSTPSGAAVTINGEARGQTPVQIDGLPPGEYTVVVENNVARAESKVEVMPEQVASVDLPLSGMLEVTSPFTVAISDRDRPLGQLKNGRLAVGAGLRRLHLANDELGFEEFRDVEVAAGAVTRLAVSPPPGVLNITADVESDVYLDGRPIGLTPLTNLSLNLGVHEVSFRNEQWGEQNFTVLVGLSTPSRLHATMKVPPSKAKVARPPQAPRRTSTRRP